MFITMSILNNYNYMEGKMCGHMKKKKLKKRNNASV